MKINHLLFFGFLSLVLVSCVSSKKFKTQVDKCDSLNKVANNLQSTLQSTKQTCDSTIAENARKTASLEQENTYLKENYTSALNQLKDLSVITGTQAESIRKSLDNINSKDLYIKDLQVAMAKKDSLNMALVMNLKGALKNVNDQDIQIQVEKGAVFISISDKMLFKSGSYEVTNQAKEVLGKVAQVIKAQPDMQFMVEGHTDNKNIHTNFIKDNWDLSVLRATAVTRILQNQYGVDPKRMIAAGRSEYISVASNDTPDGRSANRRTRIVILPELDQFFKLLEPKQ